MAKRKMALPIVKVVVDGRYVNTINNRTCVIVLFVLNILDH